MKKFLAVALMGVMLSGCSAIQSVVGTGVATDAVQSAKYALTTYVDIYQPAVIAYGGLPDCGTGPVLCKDRSILDKLKAADAAAVKSIVAANDVLNGGKIDAGEISAAISAIQQAEATIAASGALATTQK